MIASSAPDGDPVIENAIAALAQHTGSSGLSTAATEFKFDHVRAKPLSRETWLTYATRIVTTVWTELDSRHGHA